MGGGTGGEKAGADGLDVVGLEGDVQGKRVHGRIVGDRAFDVVVKFEHHAGRGVGDEGHVDRGRALADYFHIKIFAVPLSNGEGVFDVEGDVLEADGRSSGLVVTASERCGE